MKKNQNVTLSAVKCRGDLMDLKIIDLPADDAVLDIDDVEFFDWSKNNSSLRLWYCKEVVSSPILLAAIQNAIERSPTDYLAKNNVTDHRCPAAFSQFCTCTNAGHYYEIVPSEQLCSLLSSR